MKKYACYGRVVGTKYLGEVEAENAEEAAEKAEQLDTTYISLCHHCSAQVEDPEVSTIMVEERL